jgi:putative acetyltransferase
MHYSVRPAVPTDAEAIIRVHHAAVRKTAAAYYPREVIDAWGAKLTDENHEKVRRETTDPGMIVLVAEVGSAVAGFCMVVQTMKSCEVYVDPEFGRQGVGTAILKRLEDAAAKLGVRRLNMASSVKAEAFYTRQRYDVLERTVHRLSAGQEMACVRMTKSLSAI